MKAHNITKEVIAEAMSYQQYRALVQERLEQNQSTGNDHSEAMVGYTILNERRMARLDKTVKLLPETITTLKQIDMPMTWMVITEGWCGDAAQIVPIIARMAAENTNIELKFILRDEHLEIMDQFLTNNGRSIPKLILLNKESLEVLGDWGPRPAATQQLFLDAKNSPDYDAAEVKKEIQLWYTRDKAVSTQKELSALLTTVLQQELV